MFISCFSPIQEISHDWGGTSLVTVTHESIKPSEHVDIIQEEEEEMPETGEKSIKPL